MFKGEDPTTMVVIEQQLIKKRVFLTTPLMENALLLVDIFVVSSLDERWMGVDERKHSEKLKRSFNGLKWS